MVIIVTLHLLGSDYSLFCVTGSRTRKVLKDTGADVIALAVFAKITQTLTQLFNYILK